MRTHEKRSGMDRRQEGVVSTSGIRLERREGLDPRSSAVVDDEIYGFDTTTSEDDWETFFNIQVRE